MSVPKLFFYLILTFFISCKKNHSSESAGDSWVKIKKNGAWITYQGAGELGPDLSDQTKTNLGVTGVSGDQKERFDLTIQVDGPNLPAGTYNSDDANAWVDINYSLSTPNGANDRYFDIRDIDGQEPSKYSVIITSITSTELKGKFTGNYLTDEYSSDTPEMAQVTEGEFSVKRVR